jgi:Sortase domain
MRVVAHAALLGCVLALLLALPIAGGAVTRGASDPCSSAGRDTCGTTGVGFYKDYRYGIRWFGDYRGAVPDAAHTFCIDLGLWYPSADYRFRELAGPLRNRDGEAVPFERQRRLAFAVWSYGRSTNENQQAAVMLYVHSLMGDARPGEVDPAPLNPTVASLYEQIARDSARLHGPYRMEIRVPAELTVGRPATARIRVVSAAGTGVPGLELRATARGAPGPGGSVQTNEDGVAEVRLTPTSAGPLHLSVRSEPMASTLPRVFGPTIGIPAGKGQRLVAPDSQTLSEEVEAPVRRTRIAVSSKAVPNPVAVGEPSRDRLAIGGELTGWSGEVAMTIYGPFQSEDGIRCDGAPAWKATFRANGAGTFVAPPATLDQVGWYSYVADVPGDAGRVGETTPCRAAGETFRVEAQPRLQTVVSSDRVDVGTPIHDTVIVSGLAGQHVTVQAALYGPFPSLDAITCSGSPAWTGNLDVPGDGEYVTSDFTVTTPGFYTYQESIAARDFVRAAQSACGEAAETTVAAGKPQITTKVSAQETRPGASITDTATVTGLGELSALVRVTLWGPFATRGAISCSGTPSWTGSFVATGDGTYTTEPVEVARAGYYTFQETIAAGPATAAFTSPCADEAETTFVTAQPTVETVTSDEVVFPASTILDRIRVQGLGRTPAAIDVELYGPFGSRDAVACKGIPYWRGRVYARGNGEIESPRVRLEKAGFYTYRERVVGSPTVAASTTECPLAAETSLARPQIVTGRGDATRYDAVLGIGGRTPTRVRLASLGIDAPVAPAEIDVADGVLAVPPQISRTGWWRDGMAPGAAAGAILIAGHVDSAERGAGAFFRLHEAKPGDRVAVQTSSGRTFTYRVTSLRAYPKSELPTSVYSAIGPARLVLVTCGGPFDQASRHYRDNIVLTAVPS